jgi:D-alanyl-D-alanine carboxypeptidase
MSDKTFKNCVYTVIVILILVFFTKDIPLFGNKEYQDIKTIKKPHELLVLVNKNNKLPDGFVPNNLEIIDLRFSNADKKLVKEAKEKFEQLSSDARILGYNIIAVSAYRDYEYQKKLYENYVKEKGQVYADKSSARPGHSEHQTGLAVDVMGSNNDYDEFESSNEFEWMRDNAHIYGFIMRYPKGKEHITGFKYEPWHYRYVGVGVAKVIYENNLTLEEYFEQYEK